MQCWAEKLTSKKSLDFCFSPLKNNQEKIREGILERIKKETDAKKYYKQIESNPQRKLLKERIRAIKKENIQDIKFENPKMIETIFLKDKKLLKPRHQRDIGRLMSIIKAFTILNVWFRKNENGEIIVSNEDIEEGFRIWGKMSESQEYNLPPYIYKLYQEIIIPAFEEKNKDNHGGVLIGNYQKGFCQKTLCNS